jgi:hypothetical protein
MRSSATNKGASGPPPDSKKLLAAKEPSAESRNQNRVKGTSRAEARRPSAASRDQSEWEMANGGWERPERSQKDGVKKIFMTPFF